MTTPPARSCSSLVVTSTSAGWSSVGSYKPRRVAASESGTTTGTRPARRWAHDAAVAATHADSQKPVISTASTVPTMASVAATSAGADPASTDVFVTTSASAGGSNRGSQAQS